MRLRTALKLYFLSQAWRPSPGITRTFGVRDDGTIEVLVECEAHQDGIVIPRQQRVTAHLIDTLDHLAEVVSIRARRDWFRLAVLQAKGGDVAGD